LKCTLAGLASKMAGYFYIMTNAHNKVLYCGATDDLYRRTLEHKNEIYSNSFTSRYNIHKLVYFETFSNTTEAFAKEKQLKAGSRKKKIALIESLNPEWKDLFDNIRRDHQGEELIKIINYLRKI
jgi:putative endonuclease